MKCINNGYIKSALQFNMKYNNNGNMILGNKLALQNNMKYNTTVSQYLVM